MKYQDENIKNLALTVVSEACDNYIHDVKRLKYICDYETRHNGLLSRKARAEKCHLIHYIKDALEFFNSDRPELYCGIDGKTILEQLNKRLG